MGEEFGTAPGPDNDEVGGTIATSLALDGASDVVLSLDDDGFLFRCLPLGAEPERRTTSELVEEEEDGSGGRFWLGTSLRERRSFWK